MQGMLALPPWQCAEERTWLLGLDIGRETFGCEILGGNTHGVTYQPGNTRAGEIGRETSGQDILSGWCKILGRKHTSDKYRAGNFQAREIRRETLEWYILGQKHTCWGNWEGNFQAGNLLIYASKAMLPFGLNIWPAWVTWFTEEAKIQHHSSSVDLLEEHHDITSIRATKFSRDLPFTATMCATSRKELRK